MQRLGLALSGGGFRATLYHLGVVRFLRDAKILPKISHITTVSGGSILGAHLALNWDRYTGSSRDFDEAAEELINFIRLDVRNQIVRRFPFSSALNTARSMLRMRPLRGYTRPGILETYYERFLYGDVALSQLPDRPRLHILSTNLSEGCLCSFNRNGLLLQRRVRGRRDRFERIHVGLATVPMAVAASSAFPGFFPPLELNGWDVGADEGEFSRQSFTDGGVYDNLGLRMFRCIEQSWIRDSAPLRKEDFFALDDALAALESANNLPEDTPLRRLHDEVKAVQAVADPNITNPADAMVRGLWEVIRSEQLYRDPCFQNVELTDRSAQSLLNYTVESGRAPDLDNRLWLNRQIVESALSQVIGKPCLRLGRQEFDGILVSDAGGKFKVSREARKGGLIRTALRSSDILMDRVWQLELEAFENTPGVVFFPIADVVERSKDSTALDPEIQRQAARIRTDLDQFSDLEMTSLIQHGYCVARVQCRSQGGQLASSIPSDPPWTPLDAFPDVPSTDATRERRPSIASPSLQVARKLRRSSSRRIWGALLNFRDWPTYVWIVLILALTISLPLAVFEANDRARQQRMVLTAIAEMSPDYGTIVSLIQQGASTSMPTMPFTEVSSVDPPTVDGFEVLTDTRIFDLRTWSDATSELPSISYTRLRVRRKPASEQVSILRLQSESPDDKIALYCEQASLQPSLSRMRTDSGTYLWDLALDFSHVPVGSVADLNLQRRITPDTTSVVADEGRFSFSSLAETGLLEVWILLPEGRKYNSFEVSSHPIGQPELAKIVVPHSTARLAFDSIATFRIIDPLTQHRYECRWQWEN